MDLKEFPVYYQLQLSIIHNSIINENLPLSHMVFNNNRFRLKVFTYFDIKRKNQKKATITTTRAAKYCDNFISFKKSKFRPNRQFFIGKGTVATGAVSQTSFRRDFLTSPSWRPSVWSLSTRTPRRRSTRTASRILILTRWQLCWTGTRSGSRSQNSSPLSSSRSYSLFFIV